MTDKKTENQTSSLANFEFDNDDSAWASSFSGPQTPTKSTKVDDVVREVQGEEEEEFADPVPNTPVATAPAKKPAEVKKAPPTKTTKTTTPKKKEDGEEEGDDVDPEIQEQQEGGWFNQDEEDETPEKLDDESKKDKKTRTSGTVDKTKKKKEEEVADEDYQEEEEVVEADEDIEEDDDTDKDKKFFKELVKEMKDKNIFQNVEIKDDEDITEDKFFELQNEEIESRVEETLQAMSENMDDLGKRFIKFKAKGGRTEVFMAAISSPIDLDSFDENNQHQVDAVIRHYLTTEEELDGDELNDRIEWLKSGGKQKATASKYFAKMQTKRDKLVKEAEDSLEAQRKKNQKDAEDFNNSLLEVLSETESVGIIPITKADQKDLGAYMTKPVVKVGKNKYMPQMQADLLAVLKGKSKEDMKGLIALAKNLKHKFDIKDLATKVTSKVTKKAKSTLQAAKQGVKVRTAGTSGQRALTDYFDN